MAARKSRSAHRGECGRPPCSTGFTRNKVPGSQGTRVLAPAATIRSGPSGYICAAAAGAASVVSTARSQLAAHTNYMYLHRVTQADEGALSLAESACLRYHLRPRQEPKSLMRWRARKRLDGSGHAHGLSLTALVHARADGGYMRMPTGRSG